MPETASVTATNGAACRKARQPESLREEPEALLVRMRQGGGEGAGVKEADEARATRLKRSTGGIAVDMDEAHEVTPAHCAKIVKDGLITAPLFEGIAVSHSVHKA